MVSVYLFALLLLVLAAAALSYPLFFQRLEQYLLPDLPSEEFSERDALLEALSELEYSHDAGKLSDRDYDDQRAALEARYVEVTEQAPA